MTSQTPIRVVLVDDHRMVREGLRSFLSLHDDIQIVGEAGDGAEAVRVVQASLPDVVLMDLVMPGVDGATAIERIREEAPTISIIVLTSFHDDDHVRRALAAGASGYLLKDVRPERLATAIRDAAQGEGTVDTDVARSLLETGNGNPIGHDLTQREREVLGHMIVGLTNKEIGAELCISAGTVRMHVSNVLSKLGVGNRTEAVVLALRQGFLDET